MLILAYILWPLCIPYLTPAACLVTDHDTLCSDIPFIIQEQSVERDELSRQTHALELASDTRKLHVC